MPVASKDVRGVLLIGEREACFWGQVEPLAEAGMNVMAQAFDDYAAARLHAREQVDSNSRA